jgi:hypothetical protein
VLVEDDCDKICDGGWKERPYAWNPVGRVFIEGERKRKGIGYRIVKIYRYEETLERINLGYNLRIHYTVHDLRQLPVTFLGASVGATGLAALGRRW